MKHAPHIHLSHKLMAQGPQRPPYTGNDYDSGWLMHQLDGCSDIGTKRSIKRQFIKQLRKQLRDISAQLNVIAIQGTDNHDVFSQAKERILEQLPNFIIDVKTPLNNATSKKQIETIRDQIQLTRTALKQVSALLKRGIDVELGFKTPKDRQTALPKKPEHKGLSLPQESSGVQSLVESKSVSVVQISNGRQVAMTHRGVDSKGAVLTPGFKAGGSFNSVKPAHVTSVDGTWEPVMLRKSQPKDVTEVRDTLDEISHRLTAEETLRDESGHYPQALLDFTSLDPDHTTIVLRFGKKGPMLMELTERYDTPLGGADLEKQLEDDMVSIKLLTPAERLGNIKEVLRAAKALTAMHAKGVTHKDVKPPNFLIDLKKGCFRLGDLDMMGLDTDYICGTPDYMMSFESQPSKEGDLWALAVTILEIISPQLMNDNYFKQLRTKENKLDKTRTHEQNKVSLRGVMLQIQTQLRSSLDAEAGSGFTDQFFDYLRELCIAPDPDTKLHPTLEGLIAFESRLKKLPELDPVIAVESHLDSVRMHHESKEGYGKYYKRASQNLEMALHIQPDNIEAHLLLYNLYNDPDCPLDADVSTYAKKRIVERLEHFQLVWLKAKSDTQHMQAVQKILKSHNKTILMLVSKAPLTDVTPSYVAIIDSLKSQEDNCPADIIAFCYTDQAFNRLSIKEQTAVLVEHGLVDLDVVEKYAELENAFMDYSDAVNEGRNLAVVTAETAILMKARDYISHLTKHPGSVEAEMAIHQLPGLLSDLQVITSRQIANNPEGKVVAATRYRHLKNIFHNLDSIFATGETLPASGKFPTIQEFIETRRLASAPQRTTSDEYQSWLLSYLDSQRVAMFTSKEDVSDTPSDFHKILMGYIALTENHENPYPEFKVVCEVADETAKTLAGYDEDC